MPEREPAKPSAVAATVAIGKDTVALMRDLIVVALVLMFLIVPTKLKAILTAAGIQKLNVGGLEWAPELVAATNSLSEARANIATLEEQLEKNNETISAVSARLPDSDSKKVEALRKENQAIATRTSTVQDDISRAIAAAAPLVESVQPSNSPGQWGVVYSGDTSLDGAKYEVGQIAKTLNLPNARIYHRQNMYRSVSVVDSRSDAQAVLTRALNRRRDAYIVAMSGWCPSPNPKEGYIECAPPAGAR